MLFLMSIKFDTINESKNTNNRQRRYDIIKNCCDDKKKMNL